jgi:uncharacterized protein
MSAPPAEDDGAAGEAALSYERCGQCGAVWYFRRGFCPRCGDRAPERLAASGRGCVYAITTVARAPTAELRALAPYSIALVDAAEGVRMMAHAAPGLAVGDRVRLRVVPFGGNLVPYCDPEEGST